MSIRINPFHEAYVTENIPPANFVDVFSSILVESASQLFQPGNIILKGVQGCGKSMLLNLLRPEIRIAYAEARKPFPVPEGLSRFIAAGINLTRSGAIDFGQRQIEATNDEDERVLPLYFGDFLNYWIVRDLLNSILALRDPLDGRLAQELGLHINEDCLDAFALAIKEKPCWFGYLNDVADFVSLRKKINQRIQTYREFINFNTAKIPPEVRVSKSSVGEPVGQSIEVLRRIGVLPVSVPVYVFIDQYEELAHLETWSLQRNLIGEYRSVVNKFLSTRDQRVSYRIGGRRYALKVLKVFGTSAILEEERNFRIIDLDDLLRKKEHTRKWIFPRFAEDVFKRRLRHARYEFKPNEDVIKLVFGKGPSAPELGMLYAQTRRQTAIDVESSWPVSVRRLLEDLANENPFSAKLGEAWVRQHITKSDWNLQDLQARPWEQSPKRYWKKERTEQALLQIAARRSQRLLWAGEHDIIHLCGGNILVFVSICQSIWDTWLRSTPEAPDEHCIPEFIDHKIQDQGIFQASTYWYEKIPADPDGNTRQRLIKYLGEKFRIMLVEDKNMSYPGHNGFSVGDSDLNQDYEVLALLLNAVDYGSLFQRPHTPKVRDMGKRTKWYLNPILSPYFQISLAHTKEPIYVKAAELRRWMEQAGVVRAKQPKVTQKKGRSGSQLSLFEPEN